MPLPAGFKLEKDIKVPEGYQLENSTKPMPLPVGFKLEGDTKSINLPEGFQLEKPLPQDDFSPIEIKNEKPSFTALKELGREAFIKPGKTFYSGVLKGAADLANLLDFYSDKIANKLGVPETKNSIFEYLRDNWATVGDKLQKEGLSEGVMQKVYSGLGQAGFDVPVKYMAPGKFLKVATLPAIGAAEGAKEGRAKGAVIGATAGALMHGTLKGLGELPTKIKLPAAFTVGATTSPGGLEEKVAGGAVFTGLAATSPSPSMEEFKARYPGVKQFIETKVQPKGEKIYQDYINRFQSIENVTEKAKALGLQIKPGEDPGIRAREYLGIGQKVRSVLEDKTYRIKPEGKIEITGEGLRPIIRDYEKISPEKDIIVKQTELKEYLIARRTIEDLQRPKGEWTTEKIATPEQVQKAKDSLDRLNEKYGDNIKILDNTAQRLYDYQKRVLHTLVDSGNISQEQYDIILAKNPNYVPFNRIVEGIEPTEGITPVSKRRFTGAKAPIKRIKGSELEIIDPLESIVKNTYRIMDIAERNTVARNLVNLKQILPEDISPIKVKMQPIELSPSELQKIGPKVSNIKRMADIVSKSPELEGSNILAQGPEKIVQEGKKYYLNNLYKNKTYSPALNEEVEFTSRGLLYLSRKGSPEELARRFKLITKAEPIIKNVKEIDPQDIRQVGKNHYRYGLLGRFKDGSVVRVVVDEIQKEGKKFLSIFDIEDVSKKMGLSTSGEQPGILGTQPAPEKPTAAAKLNIPQEGEHVKGETTIFRPSQFKPKGNVIEVFENGDRKYYELSPNLYQAMTGLNETSSGLMVKLLSRPANWLRTGATITPEFIARNPIRDQFTALMQTNFGFKPFIDSTGAVADIVGKKDVYYDWLRSGGAYSSLTELSRKNMQRTLNELQRRPDIMQRLNIITRAQDLSQLMEQATRLGVYKAGIKKGLTPVEAGFESREATIDFARKGAKTKDVNAVRAFFNANIQAADKNIRTAMEDPMGFAVKGMTAITIPSIIFYLRNREDPNYKEIPQWERDTFWVTKVGEAYIRIPKPFLYGQIFGTVPERFFEYLDTQDPKAFDGLKKALIEAASPIQSQGEPMAGIVDLLLPTAVKPIAENFFNKSLFYNRPIVPEGKEKLLPSEQYRLSTTETAKEIGKVLNLSPAKIENLIKGWFGGSGQYALQAGEEIIKGTKKITGKKIEPERPSDLSDYPLIKGFVTRPVFSEQAESIAQFYDGSKKIEMAYNTYRQFIKEGDKDNAKKILEKYPEYKLYPLIFNTKKVLSNYNKQLERVIKSEKYTENQKRQLLEQIERKKVELVRKVNKRIESYGK